MFDNLLRSQETGASAFQVPYDGLRSIRLHYQKACTPAVKKTAPQKTWVQHLKRIQADKTNGPLPNYSRILRRASKPS